MPIIYNRGTIIESLGGASIVRTARTFTAGNLIANFFDKSFFETSIRRHK